MGTRRPPRGGKRPRRGLTGSKGTALLALVALFAPAMAFAYVHPMALGLDDRSDSRRLDATAEIHCLALNVYHEARSEPDEGKFAVAQVTLNRVRSHRYPDSVCKVVWQRAQFSWTRDGRSDRPRNVNSWKEALWIARAVFHFNPLSMVGRATHYHATYVRPFWSATHRRVRRIGRHIFYETPERS
jgi:spore germination cell wall hydrolase CwlJ-like protein